MIVTITAREATAVVEVLAGTLLTRDETNNQ